MGDEGGRSQRGNNNAYCQDNEITWMDWSALDPDLVGHAAMVAAMRKRFDVFSETGFFTGNGDVEWIAPSGSPMQVSDWENPDNRLFGMVLATGDRETGSTVHLAILFNRGHDEAGFSLPGTAWREFSSDEPWGGSLPARSVRFCLRQ
jgi:glycogen debranching enzyme